LKEHKRFYYFLRNITSFSKNIEECNLSSEDIENFQKLYDELYEYLFNYCKELCEYNINDFYGIHDYVYVEKKCVWHYNANKIKGFKVRFKNNVSLFTLRKKMNNVNGIKFEFPESSEDQDLKFRIEKDIEACKPIYISKYKEDCSSTCDNCVITKPEYVRCTNDEELKEMNFDLIVPSILSFDAEVYAENSKQMPKSFNMKDEVSSIGFTFVNEKKEKTYYCAYIGDNHENEVKKSLNDENERTIQKYLKDNEESKNNIEKMNVRLIKCDNELDLLRKFEDLIIELDPTIIMGHNIFGFDIPYFDARLTTIYNETWRNMSRFQDYQVATKKFEWNSKAYGDQSMFTFNLPGRIFIDTLPYFTREFYFPINTLDYLSKSILKKGKVDLPIKTMHLLRRMGIIMQELYYVTIDSELPYDLFNATDAWEALQQLSNLVGVNMIDFISRGQGRRGFPPIYADLFKKGYIYTPSPMKTDKDFEGGFVFKNKPGVYDFLFTNDFKSLYPSIMIAYSLCFTNLIQDDCGNNIDLLVDDKECHVFDWTSKKSGNRKYYRFNKNQEGLLTEKLKALSDARQQIKKEMGRIYKILDKHKYKLNEEELKHCTSLLQSKDKNEVEKIKEQIEKHKFRLSDEQIKNYKVKLAVLNARQLGIKKIMNSIYGLTGAQSKLKCFEIGLCTTYNGRTKNQEMAIKYDEYIKGNTIYGDTDSFMNEIPWLVNYIKKVPKEKQHKLLMKVGNYAVDHINKKYLLYPMEVELEEIKRKFLYLKQKNYVYITLDKNDPMNVNINNYHCKGLPPVKRNYPTYLKKVYKQITIMIILEKSLDEIVNYYCDRMYDLMSGAVSYKDLIIILKSIKSTYKNNSHQNAIFWNYLVNVKGQNYQSGDSVEYVFVEREGATKVGEKMQSVYLHESEKTKLDLMHYLEKTFSPNFDRLLHAIYPNRYPKQYSKKTIVGRHKNMKLLMQELTNYHVKKNNKVYISICNKLLDKLEINKDPIYSKICSMFINIKKESKLNKQVLLRYKKISKDITHISLNPNIQICFKNHKIELGKSEKYVVSFLKNLEMYDERLVKNYVDISNKITNFEKSNLKIHIRSDKYEIQSFKFFNNKLSSELKNMNTTLKIE
jgi:DNA polymerase elongation subunit (family B)